jgi:hypothetical protein
MKILLDLDLFKNHPLIEKRCAHARVSSSAAGPLAICGRLMGDYSILCCRLLSEITAVDTYIQLTLICGPGRTLRMKPRHAQSNFCRVDSRYSKKAGPDRI